MIKHKIQKNQEIEDIPYAEKIQEMQYSKFVYLYTYNTISPMRSYLHFKAFLKVLILLIFLNPSKLMLFSSIGEVYPVLKKTR